MPKTNYIKKWIKKVDDAVEYWLNNSPKLDTWRKFIDDNKTYSNLITACVSERNLKKSVRNEFKIDIDSFPEPYYGNPDDSIAKTAIVLFYNPGGSNSELHRFANGTHTFFVKYQANQNHYSKLSSLPGFSGFIGQNPKKNTLTDFIEPKKKSLEVILSHCAIPSSNQEPFFMDLVPWHSAKFGLFNRKMFEKEDGEACKQAKENVFIPATLNASNSQLTHRARQLAKRENIVVFISVGSKYSKEGILQACGFKNVTKGVILMNNPISPQISPQFNSLIPHTMLTAAGDITYSAKSYLCLWKTSGKKLIEGLEDCDFSGSILCLESQSDVDVFVINVWNRAPGMTLPDNLGPTINEILKQLSHL